MITRRHVLTGGLAVAASALSSERTDAARRKIEKRCYVAWAYGSGENWWPATDFAISANVTDAVLLQRHPGRIRVRVPYWTTNEQVGFLISGGLDNGFNGDGYHFGRGPFSVFVPGYRHVGTTLRVTMAHTMRSGLVLHAVGKGQPGEWIRLQRARSHP